MEDNKELRERIRNNKHLRKFLNDNIKLTSTNTHYLIYDEGGGRHYSIDNIEISIKDFFGGTNNDVWYVMIGV